VGAGLISDTDIQAASMAVRIPGVTVLLVETRA